MVKETFGIGHLQKSISKGMEREIIVNPGAHLSGIKASKSVIEKSCLGVLRHYPRDPVNVSGAEPCEGLKISSL